MGERKEGWYWVRLEDFNEWIPWEWRISSRSPEGLWYNSENPIEIGPRIPTPDEPWQCVPKQLDIAMVEEFEERLAEQGWSAEAAGEIDKQDIWDAQLDVAPKPGGV